MLIGLGGGAASSQTSAEESAHLDFASVQRYVFAPGSLAWNSHSTRHA